MTAAQKDGQDCVYCQGPSDGPMKVVARLRGVMLLFAHVECAEEHRMES